MRYSQGLVVFFLLVLTSTGENLAGCRMEKKTGNERVLENNGSGENNFNNLSNRMITNFNSFEDPLRDFCLKSLIEEVINIYGDTYIIIADGKQHYNLIQNFQHNFIHTLFTESKLLKQSRFRSYHNLQIFNDKIALKSILKKMEPTQSSKFFCIVKNYEEVIKIFKQFWKYRLTNIVASILINQTLHFYTYFPYSSSHCGQIGTPMLVAQCSTANGIFFHKEKIYPKPNFDFHKCPVAVTFKENIPSAYYTASHELTGWEIELMREIIERMNGIPKYKIIKHHANAYTISAGYNPLLKDSEVGGGMVISLRGLTKTDYCIYGSSICSTWIVPKNHDALSSISFIWKVFPTSVWLLFLFTTLLMAGLFKLHTTSSYITVLFKLLAFAFGTTTRTKKTSKFLGALWLWFCLIIDAIYQSGYQSTLLVPDLPHQLSSTQEILDSDLKIMGISEIITDALPHLKMRHNVTSKRLTLVGRKFSYEDWVYIMTVMREAAFLGFKETAEYHADKTELGTKIHIQQSCVIKYFLAFVLKKHSHLTESFTRISNRLNENGFVDFLFKKHMSKDTKAQLSKKLVVALKPRKSSNNNTPLSIDMDKMLIVFLFLGAGNLLALLMFFTEIMSKWNWIRVKKRFLNKMMIKTTHLQSYGR